MEKNKLKNPVIRKYLFLLGLICLFSFSVIYWSLEQPRRRLEHLFLQPDVAEKDSQSSNILDITYRPWKDDPECQEYTVKFIRNGSRPLMALVSYPGSGNTWVRGVIERLSGYFTGSAYTSKHLFVTGFYGEAMPPDCGCTIVQKTHDFQSVWNDFKPFVNHSAILIIRNPYRALVSYRNYLSTGDNQTASASSTQFTGKEWRKFVAQEIKRWQSTALRWIPKIGHGGILLYEDLVLDKPNQFRLLMRYLGVELDERRLNCVIKHDFSTFHRNSSRSSGSNATNSDPFSSFLKGIVNRAMKKVQKALTDNGHDLMLLKE